MTSAGRGAHTGAVLLSPAPGHWRGAGESNNWLQNPPGLSLRVRGRQIKLPHVTGVEFSALQSPDVLGGLQSPSPHHD